jgi:CspA family cold shock protein
MPLARQKPAEMRVEDRSGRPNLQWPDSTPIYTHRYWPDYLGRFATSFAGARFSFSSKIDEMGRWPRQSCATSHAHTQTKGNAMTNGTVKFYNDQKGFGFIQPDNGEKDVFVHATALERAGIQGLREGQKVKFDTQNDPRSGKVAVGAIELA